MNESEKIMAARRSEMVRDLRRKGIIDERVLEAIGSVERHRFVHEESLDYAYDDAAWPIGYGQTISQPYTVAYMTSLLAARCSPPAKVLEIGTGSGYQAAVLDALGYRVYSVERIPELYERAARLFRSLGIPVRCRLADGSLGWEEEVPFEGIMVTAAAPDCPQHLLGQLSPDGCLVIPVGGQDTQQMTVCRRSGDRFEKELFHHFAFVPLIGREGWN